MCIILFSGDYDELCELEKDLMKNGHEVRAFFKQDVSNGWLDQVQPIVFALLSSTVVSTTIKEYIKAKNSPITFEYDQKAKKYKLSYPRGAIKEVREMLTTMELLIAPERKEKK